MDDKGVIIEDTFAAFNIQTWLSDCILWIDALMIFCAWSFLVAVTRYVGDNNNFAFINWHTLKHSNNCLVEIGNAYKQRE